MIRATEACGWRISLVVAALSAGAARTDLAVAKLKLTPNPIAVAHGAIREINPRPAANDDDDRKTKTRGMPPTFVLAARSGKLRRH